MLTITVQGSFNQAKELIQEAKTKGKVVEFRLDLLPHSFDCVSALRRECSLPVIFTFRKKSQGGAFEASERVRRDKIVELLPLLPDYLDLEYDCSDGFIQEVARHFPQTKIICSYHNFERTPVDLEGVLKRMNRSGASVYKLATFARSSIDSLRMLNLVQNHTHVAGMCMGKKGQITRILAPVVGSVFTYATIGKGADSTSISADVLEDHYHFSHLNRNTSVYALIGDPIDQSPGHLFHNLLYHHLKLDAVYVKFNLKESEIETFFELIKALPFKGFSVTMPLKQRVAIHLKEIDPIAKLIGAVNTLTLERGQWKGFNTDGKGGLDTIEKRVRVKGKRVVILGAGGTARSLAFESIRRGAEVFILSRRSQESAKLALALGRRAIALENQRQLTSSFEILINATPVGMKKNSLSPFPKGSIRKQMAVLDVVINPQETPLIRQAKRKGCAIFYGYEMFTRQAIAQIAIWQGRSFDPEIELDQIIKRLF